MTGPLPRDIPPRRDLWPLLEQRLARRQRARARLRVGAAGAGLLVLTALPVALLWPTPLERAQAQYTRARQSLLRALDEQAHRLDPTAVDLVRQDLETVDRDLSAIQTALRSAPNGMDVYLAALEARYERDTRLLEDTARLLGRPVSWKEGS